MEQRRQIATFLERVKSGGVEIDPNRRRLSQKKANYSQGGFEITLRWTRGVFVPLADTAGFAADLACAKFLELVDAYAAEQKPLNPRSGPSYAPKVFSEDPRSDGISKARFKAAMALLFDDGAIVEDAIVVNRKTRQTIVRAGKG